ncbi:MAG: hypothetical protein JWO67_2363 [Streptosporangiaceae bacterium]|nr:hypothetical protein [Streptosporangiaceae bacterium]
MRYLTLAEALVIAEAVTGVEAATLATVAEVGALGECFRPWRTLAVAYLYRNPMACGRHDA